jgi:hypothetical protein
MVRGPRKRVPPGESPPKPTIHQFVRGRLRATDDGYSFHSGGATEPVVIDGEPPIGKESHFIVSRPPQGFAVVKWDRAGATKAKAAGKSANRSTKKKATKPKSAKGADAKRAGPREVKLAVPGRGREVREPRSMGVRTVSGGAPGLGKRR